MFGSKYTGKFIIYAKLRTSKVPVYNARGKSMVAIKIARQIPRRVRSKAKKGVLREDTEIACRGMFQVKMSYR